MVNRKSRQKVNSSKFSMYRKTHINCLHRRKYLFLSWFIGNLTVSNFLVLSWTETFIRSIPKLLVWIIAIGISAPVLMKATVTKISKDHLTCSVQWDSVQRNHEQKFSELCEKNLTTVKHHSNFITETHGTEWFEAKLESCLDKNMIKNHTCGM